MYFLSESAPDYQRTISISALNTESIHPALPLVVVPQLHLCQMVLLPESSRFPSIIAPPYRDDVTETTSSGTRIKPLLTPRRESIIDSPPYINGTLQLLDCSFSLFYKVTKDDHAARHIDLAHASLNELEQLAQACEPTASGVDDEDESYFKWEISMEDVLTPDLTILEKIINPAKGSRVKRRSVSLIFVSPTPHVGDPCSSAR
ncbi:hypothetical protein BC827DRAFT_82657 [Russula dissimulans]|nr:hypothetical protein BC827DRAFT_82657 [Russula dissimulans]